MNREYKGIENGKPVIRFDNNEAKKKEMKKRGYKFMKGRWHWRQGLVLDHFVKNN